MIMPRKPMIMLGNCNYKQYNLNRGEYRKVCVNFKLLMILNINIQNLFMFLTKLNILYNDIFVKTAFLSLSNFSLDRLNFSLFF